MTKRKTLDDWENEKATGRKGGLGRDVGAAVNAGAFALAFDGSVYDAYPGLVKPKAPAKKAAKAKAEKPVKPAKVKAEKPSPAPAKKAAKKATDRAEFKPITPVIALELQAAFDYFNKALFNGALPQCSIILHRMKGARGYFWCDRWSSKDGSKAHELALNPDTMRDRSTKDVLSTLVHEMTHLQQQEMGTAPKRAYHNKEWAGLMEDVGLMPSTTGAEGGKRTGQKCSHYIISGGAFDAAADDFLKGGFEFSWSTLPAMDVEVAKKKRASKTKFTCPTCEANAWGKPDLRIECAECDEPMVAENSGEDDDGED